MFHIFFLSRKAVCSMMSFSCNFYPKSLAITHKNQHLNKYFSLCVPFRFFAFISRTQCKLFSYQSQEMER